jgi:hypothetical protein
MKEKEVWRRNGSFLINSGAIYPFLKEKRKYFGGRKGGGGKDWRKNRLSN